MTATPCRVTCVIPAHNEAVLIGSTVRAIAERWAEVDTHQLAEIIVVDDGSSDGTADTVRALHEEIPAVRLVQQPQSGKGAALKRGVLESTGEVVYFIDADLPFGPDDQVALATRVSVSVPVVCGNRAAAAKQAHNSPVRLAASSVFSFVSRTITGLSIRDSQCGLKAFEAGVARKYFGALAEPGFAMDVELLLRMTNDGVPITDHPVHLLPEQRVSAIRPIRTGLTMTRALLKIRRNVRRQVAGGLSERTPAGAP